jgi:hypothetical protein
MGGVVVEYVPSTCKALGFTPIIGEKKKKKKLKKCKKSKRCQFNTS